MIDNDFQITIYFSHNLIYSIIFTTNEFEKNFNWKREREEREKEGEREKRKT